VDCHVHIYESFEIADFLDSALANFRAAAQGLGATSHPSDPPPGFVLMFTESLGHDYFASLVAAEDSALNGRWQVRHTAEEISLVAERDGGGRLTLVAGRQIAARGGLEVLALGTRRHYRDGENFLKTVAQVIDDGDLAVVPWGFGKWWLSRGRMVDEAVQKYRGRGVFLGDNGGRIRYGPPPRLFARAKKLGVWTLPGTDPLPLRGHGRRAGAYGCVLPMTLDRDRPGSGIVTYLARTSSQPATFGALQPFFKFCAAQVAMQARKRLLRHGSTERDAAGTGRARANRDA
jgi:hypothetical protein